MPHRHTRRMLPLLAALLALGGCATLESWNLPLPGNMGRSASDQETARAYPEDAERGDALNIEVVRTDNAVRLVNRTVNTYEDAELWLNHEYGAPVGTIETGRNEPVALNNFVNQHGERYPLAVFLAPDLDEALVEADLVIDGVAHPLPVRLEAGWTEP